MGRSLRGEVTESLPADLATLRVRLCQTIVGPVGSCIRVYLQGASPMVALGGGYSRLLQVRTHHGYIGCGFVLLSLCNLMGLLSSVRFRLPLSLSCRAGPVRQVALAQGSRT
jgi:hypothetical protein